MQMLPRAVPLPPQSMAWDKRFENYEVHIAWRVPNGPVPVWQNEARFDRRELWENSWLPVIIWMLYVTQYSFQEQSMLGFHYLLLLLFSFLKNETFTFKYLGWKIAQNL